MAAERKGFIRHGIDFAAGTAIAVPVAWGVDQLLHDNNIFNSTVSSELGLLSVPLVLSTTKAVIDGKSNAFILPSLLSFAGAGALAYTHHSDIMTPAYLLTFAAVGGMEYISHRRKTERTPKVPRRPDNH